ncbi:MAG: DUF4214 domain-containing protein [Acidobacteriota bacterium]|nr:DUF4214 domain-containing protein [Acidobacteriota bacterium]
MLCLSLTATSTPAAPPVLKDLASGAWLGAALWLDSSGWSVALREVLTGQLRPGAAEEEQQEERDARVTRVEVSPGGEVTLRAGERVRFAAVAFDEQGGTVGGVKFKWQAEDLGRGRRTRISPAGEFAPRVPGAYRVTAEGAGHQAQVTVNVAEGEGRGRPEEEPVQVKEVSTDDLPPEASAKRRRARPKGAEQARRSGRPVFAKASFAPAAAGPVAAAPAAAMLAPEGWNQDNYYYADDPGNEPGDPPGGPLDEGAGNGNFQTAAPVVSLPGRGLDLSLGLVYNSRLWSKTGSSEITFDADRTWPAPGWSLGFGKMVGMGAGGSMLIEPDGTRRPFTGTVTSSGLSVSFTGKTSDGSFIDYHSYTYNGAMSYGYAKHPNGTTVDYGAYGDGALYPTQIRDANGNYITITYRNNRGPQLATVTDTLGRAVTFNYDAAGLLTSVTAPGLGGAARTLVELRYVTRTVSYNFPGLTARLRASSFPFLQAVRYPGTGTGYWFGDADSYSPYGMISKVSERRGMGAAGTAVVAGTETVKCVYNYPMNTLTGYADAPGYTTKTETWDGMDTAAAVTTYAVFQNSTPRRVEITHPDGTENIQYSYNSPGTYLDGLVYQDDTKDSAGTLLQSSTVTWQQGAYNSPRPTRMDVTDERGQMKRTELTYGTVYNQVIEAREYDYGGTALLRKTVTAYENGASYVNNHIFSLPKKVEVFASDGTTRVSQTEYVYDGQPLADAPGVVMHLDSHDPYAPQYWVEEYCYEDCSDPYMSCRLVCEPGYWTSDYNPSTDFRGNVTEVKTYANAAALTGAVTEGRTYDINGNQVTASTSCCEQTAVTYTSATQYAYPSSRWRGSATDSAVRVTVGATYDFSTGLTLSQTDENGRVGQQTYFAATLRPQQNSLPTGARTSYQYDDSLLKVTETVTAAPAAGGGVAGKVVKYLNGLGQVRREEALAAPEAATWDASVLDVVETKYDRMGRVWKQSRPYRKGSEVARMTEHLYDEFGRVVERIMPDGSRTRAFYNETARPPGASAAPGETIRFVDPWGRERWARTDALGRLAEVVEPNPNGDGSVLAGGALITTYGYDTRGNLTLVTQGAQQRRFRYDSLGRLTHQKLAEARATLNDAGQYVGATGMWSSFFSYDARSNMITRRDARGVLTTYTYNDDPLNRLQSVSYAVGASYDTSSPIQPAASVTYEYVTAGDLTRVKKIRTSGISAEEYAYDAEGRVSEQKLTLDSRPTRPLVTNYGYDSLERVTTVTYPQQYPSTTRKVVTHSFDVASRLSGLQVGGAAYASNIVYNAESQATSVDVGAGVGNWKQEQYTYDPVTGLLTNQKVLRAGDATQELLDLSYDYLRPGTTAGRAGQLTKVTNHLDAAENRTYEYDALGRLRRATGGSDGRWTQRYEYDRYGNRRNVYSKPVEQFVRDFYQGALARQPNSTELQNWVSALRTAYSQGQAALLTKAKDLGRALFQSAEYAARNRTDRDFVADLYRGYLQRAPDQAGWDYWTGVVASAGREAVRQAFEGSAEFDYGVNGLSPLAPASGVPVGRDGLAGPVFFDAATNRVSAAGWQYDAAGNQTRTWDGAAWRRMEYDMAGRLVRVEQDNGTLIASHTYGPTSARLVTQEGATRTYYAWGAGGVAAEYAETDGTASATSPQWVKNYIYVGDRLLATQAAAAGAERVEYHHPDRLGTRLVSNAADTGFFEQATLPFGTALNAESQGATQRRFTSYDRSAATGLDYAVNRHYDPRQGRFTQVDPLGPGAASPSDPQTWNMYSYCGNDPVNQTDPDGLFFGKLFKWIGKILKWVAVAIAVALIVIATINIGNPFVTGTLIAKLFFTAGALLAGAFGPPWLKRVISAAGTAVGVFQRKPGIIWNFDERRGGWRALLPYLAFLGAVNNFISAFQQGNRQAQAGQQNDPCPQFARDFFNKYADVFNRMSQQVGTDVNHIAALAALESDWGRYPTAVRRNNIWGMLYRGRIITFRRVNPYDYWVNRFGPYARGATSIEQFRDQLKPIYAPEDDKWGPRLVERHTQIQEYRRACGV